MPDIEATIDALVEATISARFKITFTPETGGFWDAIVDPQPGPDGKYPAGTEVKIRAFLRLAHSSFVRWEGDASGASPETSVIVDRDLNIHAVFLHVGTPTPRPPTRTPTPTPRPTPAPTNTSVPTPTLAPTPTKASPVMPPPTAAPTPTLTPLPTATPTRLPIATPDPECIPSGDHRSIQNALTEPGSKAVLCPNAVFELGATVVFTHDDQEIYTQGLPTDDSRAFLKIVRKDVVVAISAEAKSRVKLRNVIIDGSRPEFGIGTGGLIEFGGAGSDQLVEWVKAYEPRGWSVLVLNEGDDHRCSGAIARNNELGPAGRAEYIIADGISLACRNSVVTDNTIIDATDGGIVIFQAPGSLVANNTIKAVDRIMFYGISMVDTGPYDGDFSGTRVIGNVIEAEGALIRHGIDMGPFVGCIPQEELSIQSRGAVVADNVLKGEYMGYGFVVSGVEDWTVTGNVDLSTHLEIEGDPYCFERIVDHPAGFQINSSISTGTFQEEFEEAVLSFGSSLWPLQTIVSEECASDLIGFSRFEAIKSGRMGPLWPILETSENGELIGRCISAYEPPDITGQGNVQVGVEPCMPFCAEVVLFNIHQTDTVDMRDAVFFLDGFLVGCIGLPDSIPPGEQVRCTIEDFVTPGFQVISWYGFPPQPGGWGFEYPFEGQ